MAKKLFCPNPRTYWIETYGCQMNTAESNALELQLQGAGLTPAPSAEEADSVIVNTCSVRQSAENRIWGRLGLFQYIKSLHPQTLIVTGCMAERLGEELQEKASAVDYVVGTNDKQKIVEILTQGALDALGEETYGFTSTYYKPGDFSSYVPIMNGCNNFCTYCIVPYVRGREISRPVQDIIEEIKRLESLGVKEITLLGQNVNSYTYTLDDGTLIRFPQLLTEICRHLETIRWVRFESPHPKDFSEELIAVIAREDRVAKHLHIPLQSGSTRILQLMNRKYTRERYLDLIASIQKAIPHITFATDVMVGFPGETEEEFEETLSLLAKVGFIETFMYYWNPREGTKATEMDEQIPETVKAERLQRLITYQHRIMKEKKEQRANGVVDVLITATSRNRKEELLGRTEHGEMVAFIHSGNHSVGDITKVNLTGLNGNTYTGEEIT